jgi:hypothetical protein
VKTADLCHEHGISAATFYGWKSKYGGMDVSEAQRLKAMEDGNRRLKLLVAELSLHGEALKTVIGKKPLGLAGLREEVAFLSVEFRLSERTACELLGVERSSYRYELRPDRNIALREELVKLARQKPCYGYRRLHALLERRGHVVNVKRVYRLQCEGGPGGAAPQAQAAAAGSSAGAASDPAQPVVGDGLHRRWPGDG